MCNLKLVVIHVTKTLYFFVVVIKKQRNLMENILFLYVEVIYCLNNFHKIKIK